MDEHNLRLVALAAAKHGVAVADLQAHSVNTKWVAVILPGGEKFVYAVADLEIEAALADEARAATTPTPSAPPQSPPAAGGEAKRAHTRKR